MKLITKTIAVVLSVCTLNAHAQGIALVSDITAIPRWVAQASSMAQQINKMTDQYNKLVETYNKTVQLYDKTVDTYNALTGGRGLAFLRNGTFESGIRRFIPDDIYALRNMRLTGANRPGAFGSTGFWAQQLRTGYGLPEGSQVFRNSQAQSTPYGREFGYRETQETAQVLMASSNTTHFATEERLKVIEDVLRKMEQGGPASNDLKRAMDNNTRMNAEVAFLLTEMIRQSAQQGYLQGASAHEQLTQQAARARVLSFRSYRSR
jgi:hypothetical protein